jgi:hypothetical protein
LLIYAISLPYKFAQDFDWVTGDALHWTIASDMWWSRGWLSELTLGFNGILRKAMTWGTVAVEGLFPLLVCFRLTRVPIVLAIIWLHLGIAFCIPGVTLFTLSMVAGAAMFLPAKFFASLVSFWPLYRDNRMISQVLAEIMHPVGLRDTSSDIGFERCR